MASMVIDRIGWTLTVQFEEAPPRPVRDTLKRNGFRFDPATARWERSLEGVTPDRVAHELERAGAALSYVERTREGERRLERRLVGSSVRLAPVESAAPPATEESREVAPVRHIRARRCWECGRLVALDRHNQAELNRRVKLAYDEQVRELVTRGEPPFLASAPIPVGVEVVGSFYCGC